MSPAARRSARARAAPQSTARKTHARKSTGRRHGAQDCSADARRRKEPRVGRPHVDDRSTRQSRHDARQHREAAQEAAGEGAQRQRFVAEDRTQDARARTPRRPYRWRRPRDEPAAQVARARKTTARKTTAREDDRPQDAPHAKTTAAQDHRAQDDAPPAKTHGSPRRHRRRAARKAHGAHAHTARDHGPPQDGAPREHRALAVAALAWGQASRRPLWRAARPLALLDPLGYLRSRYLESRYLESRFCTGAVMKYSVLGFLIDQPMHGYALKRALSPALPPRAAGERRHALSAAEAWRRGLVRKRVERGDGGRDRTSSTRPPKAGARSSEWLRSTDDEGDEVAYDFLLGHPFLTKCLFFGRLDAGEVAAKLEEQLAESAAKLETFKAIGAAWSSADVDPLPHRGARPRNRAAEGEVRWLKRMIETRASRAQRSRAA